MSEENHSVRRSSGRTNKIKLSKEEIKNEPIKVRSCDKTGCFAESPKCCLLNELCTMDGYTSRWYHMSLGEHFCNNCFDNYYRTTKEGYSIFKKWCNKWADSARGSKPTLKRFVASELLPYWVQCSRNTCSKWRKVVTGDVLDSSYFRNFTCQTESELESCDAPEDSDASLVLDPFFVKQLSEEPLLKNSPASPFLHRFLAEDVGMCPLACLKTDSEMPDNIHPFLMQQCGESSIWPKPDEVSSLEEVIAKELTISRPMFLGLRNLIISVWNRYPSKWLTVEEINAHLNCRGLIRIYLFSCARRILSFLEREGSINYGVITNPKLDFEPESPQVVIVGAGVAGLAAARHLHNMGVKVIVCESKPKGSFGRVCDTPAVGLGAYIIEGLKNNPFTIMSHQTSIKYQILDGAFVMFDTSGKAVDAEKTQCELDGLLAGAQEWAMQNKIDSPCQQTLLNNREEINEVYSSFSSKINFNCLLSRLGIKLRSDLRFLTVLNFEFVLGLAGQDGFFPGGLHPILEKLAEGLDIRYDCEVTSIGYNQDAVQVTASQQVFTAPKVLITVPLPVLQNNGIEFMPPLPMAKISALKGLGNFYCEKVILEFPHKFWTKKSKTPFSEFSIVSDDSVCSDFYDVTVSKKGCIPTLMTYIMQPVLDSSLSTKDELAIKCVALLKKTFTRVPEPSKCCISNFQSESLPFGCYVKSGCDQKCFDGLACDIDQRLYFAGEAAFKNIPSTVTGAYLSGLREAAKMLQTLE